MAKPKMEIVLQFLTFDLEHDPLQVGEGDCKYDWLDIWDGIPQGKDWRMPSRGLLLWMANGKRTIHFKTEEILWQSSIANIVVAWCNLIYCCFVLRKELTPKGN